MAKIVLDPEAFKVLASDTRIQILKSLDSRPKTVSELSRELELNKATVFEHLQQLLNGGLVKKKDKEGRKWVYYTLTYKGTSLLHPETSTFMVLFSLAALGSVGAMWQLGNWLAWWAMPELLTDSRDEGSSDAGPEGGGASGGDPESDGDESGDSTAADDSGTQEAGTPESGDEGAPASDGGGFFDFLGDPSFWIFFVLLAASVALLVSAVMLRRRARQGGTALPGADEGTARSEPAENEPPRVSGTLKRPASGHMEGPPPPDQDPPDREK